MNTLRYLWAHPYGRLAVLTIVVGVIGLTLHYWAGFILLSALRLPTSPYNPSVTANCADDQIAKVVDPGVALTRRDSEVTA